MWWSLVGGMCFVRASVKFEGLRLLATSAATNVRLQSTSASIIHYHSITTRIIIFFGVELASVTNIKVQGGGTTFAHNHKKYGIATSSTAIIWNTVAIETAPRSFLHSMESTGKDKRWLATYTRHPTMLMNTGRTQQFRSS